MGLFVKSISLGFRAFPHLIISKLSYEFKWSAGIGVIAMFSILAMFTVPALVVLLPISYGALGAAMKLGTLHSMLEYIGLSKSYNTEFLIAEIIKITFVRAIIYLPVFIIVFGVLVSFYGQDYLMVAVTDQMAFYRVEYDGYALGHLPATMAALLLFALLSLIAEAILAVPTAAAAYGIGPSDHSFNGFWGMGYRWISVLFCRIIYLVFVAGIGLVGFVMAVDGFEYSDALNIVLSFVNQTPLKPLPSTVDTPNLDGLAAKTMFILWIILGYFSAPIWTATCALAFRERLAIEKRFEEANRPSPDTLRDNKAAAARALWEDRMPPSRRP